MAPQDSATDGGGERTGEGGGNAGPRSRIRGVATRLCAVSVVVLAAACNAAEGQSGEGPPRAAAAPRAQPGVPPAQARRVEVATVQPSVARLELALPGEIEGSRDALLGAALGGYVERVRVADGERVRRGQVLVEVDASSHRARLGQARIELEAAERERDRARRLGDAIPAAQRDQAETRYAAAVAAMRTARVAASRAVIRAPFDGVVAEVGVEVGEVAPPGAPVVRLVKLDPVHVVATAPDRDVVALREGMDVVVRVEAQADRHAGRIVHVNPTANPRTRAFTVKVEVPNPDGRLLPGMIATVHVSTEVGGEELLVPQDWIVTRRDGLGVFVVQDGVARWRPVELGRVVRQQVAVESGIEPGDPVVVTGHRDLVDGDPVLVARTGTCCRNGRVVFE